MTEVDLQALLTDLVALQKRDGFGAEFALSLLEKDRYDQLIVHVPWSIPPLKLEVGYDAYPAVPTVRPRGDESFSVHMAALLDKRMSDAPISLPDLVDMIVAAAGRAQMLHLRTPITEIRFDDAIYNQILIDFMQYAPNEYAFMCSGQMTDGTVEVDAYYPGEMAISTPVYCELTAEFIDKTVYDDIPSEHDIIVWGHVHPIESPSGTDAESFEDLAAWDKEIAHLGMIKKRSVALLVSSFSRAATFYDVHTDHLIPHVLTGQPELAADLELADKKDDAADDHRDDKA